METNESLDKLEEICSKEENIRKILQAKTKEDIKPLFEGSGIELTDEKFDILKKAYLKVLKGMSEKELASISGGKVDGVDVGAVAGLTVGALCGSVMGPLVACKTSKDSDFDGDFVTGTGKLLLKAFAVAGVTALMGGAVGGLVGLEAEEGCCMS